MAQEKKVHYNGKSVEEEKLEKVPIVSFDHKLEYIYQENGTINKIEECFLSNQGITVYPKDPDNENANRLIQRFNDLNEKGFAYMTISLGTVCNFQVKDRPNGVLMEVLLVTHSRPATLFVLTDFRENKGISKYVKALALGVRRNILKFINEQFSLVYGSMMINDLETEDSLIKALEKIEKGTSDSCVCTSLYMSPEKFAKVTTAYLMSVTLSGLKCSDVPCLMTVEQFKLVTENIDKKKVTVTYGSSSCTSDLMMEIARRLQKSGPTLLVMDSDDAIAIARQNNTCSFYTHGADLQKFLGGEDNIQNIVSTVQHSSFEHLSASGHLWYFLPEETEILPQNLQELRDRTQADIRYQSELLPETSKVGQITNLFKESGMKLVTVTGNSGAGKSAICLMVLAALQQFGYIVFSVQSPEEYDMVSKLQTKKAILLSNIFGGRVLDPKDLPMWQKILGTFLPAEETSYFFHETLILFSGSRDSIAKVLPKNLKLWLLDSKRTIDLSGVHLISEDKEIILSHLLQKNGLTMSSSASYDICHQQFDHGFIHSCLMYVTLRLSNTVKEHESRAFFSDPMRYIERIVSILTKLKSYFGEVLKKIVKNGGFVKHDEDDFDTFHPLMKSLLLRKKKNEIVFRHPSIHARVACTLANTEHSFLKEICSHPFVIRHLRYVQEKPGDNKQIYITPDFLELIIEKLSTKIESLHYAPIECEIMKTPEICTRVLKHMEQGEDRYKIRDHKNETLLDVACRCRNKPAINFLLSHDVDINGICMKGKTPLHSVCDQADVDFEIVKQLVEKGADVNQGDISKKKPLHYICEKATQIDADLLGVVVPSPQHINTKDAVGNTALHYYCQRDEVSKKILEALISKGMDVNVRDSMRKIPLFHLCEKHNLNRSCQRAISFLLCEVDDINLEDENGNTALLELLQNFFEHHRKDQWGAPEPSEEASDLIALFNEFLDRGADPSKQNKQGMNILKYICITGLEKHLSLVIKQLGPNARSELSKWSLLHLSCATVRPEPEIIRQLLASKQNILYTDRQGRTPLHTICQGPTITEVGKGNFVQKLPSYSRKIMQSNIEEIASHLLVKRGLSHRRKTVLQNLPATSASQSSTSGFSSSESSRERKSRAKKLCRKMMFHDYADMTDNKGRTALHLLCMRKESEIDKELFDILKNVSNIRIVDYSGMTALHYLVLKGSLDFVQEILTVENVDFPVTPDFEPGLSHAKSEHTPLHLACMTSNPNRHLVELLVTTGANVNKSDSSGKRPLDYASEMPVEVVFENQNRALSPEDILDIQGKRKDILHILLKHGANE